MSEEQARALYIKHRRKLGNDRHRFRSDQLKRSWETFATIAEKAAVAAIMEAAGS